MTIDLGELYRGARSRISELVSGHGVDPTLQVPATPEWTVHSVVAHVSGIAADASSGNMEGAPGEAWTAAQVARGAGRTIAEMVEEWETNGPLTGWPADAEPYLDTFFTFGRATASLGEAS